MPLEIEVLLTENDLAEQFVAALRKRYLPEKFFYWSPLSVKAWLELCQASQPYKNYSRSYELVRRHAGAIARQCPRGRLEVVGLGAGQGDKDVLLLKALKANGRDMRYRPVDSSSALLEMAALRAVKAGFSARGLKADVAGRDTVRTLAASAAEPRLYLILGNTLGVIDPRDFLSALRNLLRSEDSIVVDAELYDSAHTMVGYDNPVNRNFAFAPLASVGLEEGRDGRLVFESQADGRLDGLTTVSKHFRTARGKKISVAGQAIKFEAGEKIEMSPSWKYTRAAFLSLLRDVAGLEPLQEFLSEDSRFLMAFAKPARR